MKRIPLKYIQTHNPLFLAGTNFGTKIDLNRRSDATLIYDREFGEVHLFFKGEMAIIPLSGISDMWPKTMQDFMIESVHVVEAPTIQEVPQLRKPVKAQVSTPTDHVFAQGAGKTRD